MNQNLHLSLEGIGASLSIEDGLPIVKEIVPGGAADKDGRLMPEDKIVGLEDEDGAKDDFYGKKLSDIVRKIRGPKGTKVRLLVQPADSKEVKTYELTRQKIELKEQQAAGKVIDTKGPNGQPFKVGVIQTPLVLRRHPGRHAGRPGRHQRHRGRQARSLRTSRSRTPTPWWWTSAGTPAGCSPRRSPSPACSSTRGRWSRSATSRASSTSMTTTRGPSGMARSPC